MKKLFAVLAMASLACGTERSSVVGAQRSDAAGFPAVIETAAGSVELRERPSRVVSISSTATEILFAIGADDQVIAVDDQSDYPPGVPTTALSGYKPNVEAIAGYRPDLVVATDDAIGASLRKIGIPLLVAPAATTLDEAYEQFVQLGEATGHTSEAAAEVARIERELAELVQRVPKFEQAPAYYHELDNTYFSATSKTFIGQLYAMAGLRNIADAADKAGTGYPQLSAEYIVRADPDLIFLADSECCDQTPERVARRPGWNGIAAVREGGVVDMGDDIASRWGPRVVDFFERVVEAVRDLDARR